MSRKSPRLRRRQMERARFASRAGFIKCVFCIQTPIAGSPQNLRKSRRLPLQNMQLQSSSSHPQLVFDYCRLVVHLADQESSLDACYRAIRAIRLSMGLIVLPICSTSSVDLCPQSNSILTCPTTETGIHSNESPTK